MLGLSKTGNVSASATARSASSRDLYQRYAVALYRQALRNVDDSALAEPAVYDVILNEYALALMPECGEDNARYRRFLGMYPRDMAALLRAVLRRLTTYSSGDRGPDDAGDVDRGAVHANSVADQVAADDLGDEALPRGVVDRAECLEQQRQ
jgi:hypothetical protein